MRCIILIPCLLNGGTERQTLSLCQALRLYQINVYILCYFEYDIAIVNEYKESGAHVKLLGLNRKINFINLIFKLKAQISIIRPRVVHVQYMSPGAIPIIAARLAGAKTVFATVHQPYTNSHGRLAWLILRLAHLLTTKFIAVSQNTENSWFGSTSLFDENKPAHEWGSHFTIYNSVDINKIKEIVQAVNIKALKSEKKIPADSIVIGTVSRLRHEKGIDLLIDSFISLKKEGQNIHLVIVGSGPDEELLKQKVINQNCQDVVTFCGAAEWSLAIGLMSITDIFVIPSRFEGFGLAAAEAMAAEKPVISSDVFGLREVVDHGKTGITFPNGDVNALASAMKMLVLNKKLRKTYGANGFLKVKEKFDHNTMINKIRALYNYI